MLSPRQFGFGAETLGLDAERIPRRLVEHAIGAVKQRRLVLAVVLGLALAAVPSVGSADSTGTITCPSTVEGWSLMPLDVAGIPSYENRTADWVAVNL